MRNWAFAYGRFLCGINPQICQTVLILERTGHATNCGRCKLFCRPHTELLVDTQRFSNAPLAIRSQSSKRFCCDRIITFSIEIGMKGLVVVLNSKSTNESSHVCQPRTK